MTTSLPPAYLQRVAHNILPLSRNQHNVTEALREWEYRGDGNDVQDAVETCQLCDHYPIRYQFEIVNRFTTHQLQIGSECITRFDVAVIDEDGLRQRGAAAATIVAKDRRKMEDDSRRRAVRRALVQLAKVDDAVDSTMLASIADDAHERGLSPKQASLIVWRLTANKIDLQLSYLKVKLKKDAEQDSLLEMDDFKVRQLWPCLSSAQQRWYNQKKPAFDAMRARRNALKRGPYLPGVKK
ncbi:hypothetical protein OWM54_43140 [Myxococcus sp. MISCRS1]|uniref:hypothetical protein n=1 Tax=Myxococcus sp. MISCRS1 TaxID=2996786 RepID=UPI0022711C9D|nr:hypothetical protein [Myxococcus sp. MISCRS1]MCY1003962.1 hypothetical protein [Myxococcus sp. MISCRS1]